MSEWRGCYNDSWQGVIVPGAFAHPAKFARGLIRRIYEHMLAQGYIAPGDKIVDPFGGVGLGGLDAMTLGLHWTGCELEPRFVELAGRNIEKWTRDLAMLNGKLGTARVLEGDSRRLAEIVGMGAAVVSSPPFGEQQSGGGIAAALAGDSDYKIKLARSPGNVNQGYANQADSPGNLAALRADESDYAAAVSSPPYEASVSQEKSGIDWDRAGRPDRVNPSAMVHGVQGVSPFTYGRTPGQLGSMPSGSFDSVVSSPPYAESLSSPKDGEHVDEKIAAAKAAGNTAQRATWGSNRGSAGWSADTYGNTAGQLATLRADDAGFAAAVSSSPYADAVNGSGEGPGARHDPIFHNGDNAFKQSSDNGYGNAPGQLARLSGDGFTAAVSSPPFEVSDNRGAAAMPDDYFVRSNGKPFGEGAAIRALYDTPANIGNDTGDNFWSAARVIVEQTHAVLKPGGYAAWVTKDFVRKGERVPFSDQWEQLCEAVGFEPVERIAAMLVEEHGDQLDIFGGMTARRRERKSFFRRLAEKKGAPRIDHEDVIIMRKAAA